LEVLCEASHLSMEKNLAKKSQQRKVAGLINGCRQRQVNIYKPQSPPSSTFCVRSTCKFSLGRLKHCPFMVPQNQDFRCLSATFHVNGCLGRNVWVSKYYNATATTLVLRHQRVNLCFFAGQIGHMTGTISSSVNHVCILHTQSLHYHKVWQQITYRL